MTGLLVSVATPEEALLAVDAGADFIDLKNPMQGALGALPLPVIRRIMKIVAGRRPVSATIGDLPMQPDLIAAAVTATAATGVDIVKIGFFGHEAHAECIAALAPQAAAGIRMVAVLFADAEPDFGVLEPLARAGFHGVMLDTATKRGQRLGDCLSADILGSFVAKARSLGLLTGLAGSLSLEDLPKLMTIGPDYLGMRGGLCHESDRRTGLEPEKLGQAMRLLYPRNISDSKAA